MGIRRAFFRRQRRNFAYRFQTADDAMQMDIYKTLYPFLFVPHEYVMVEPQF